MGVIPAYNVPTIHRFMSERKLQADRPRKEGRKRDGGALGMEEGETFRP